MCLFVTSIWSQNGEVSGTVLLDTEAIQGIEVYEKESGKGTTTDSEGGFKLKGLSLGKKILYFSYLGAKSQTKEVIVSDNTTPISVYLVSDNNLEEVVISVPGSKLQKDLVVNVEKKKLTDINRSSAVTLAESITNINGVSQTSTGVSIGKPVIRGLSSNRVVTFAQGTRIENQQWGGDHGLGLSSNGTSSVEVIKGPASLLYGSDAIGGVLYFVDEAFTDEKLEGFVETGYFTNARSLTTNAGVKLSFGKFKVNTNIGYTQAGDYKLSDDADFDGERLFNSRFSDRNAKISLGWDGEKVQSKLTYSILNNFLGIPLPFEGNPIFTNSFDSDLISPIFKDQESNFVLAFQDLTQHILSLENKFKIKESDAALTLGYSINDRLEFNEVRDNPDLHLYLQVFNYNFKVSDVVKTDVLDLTVGAQGLFQDNENRGTVVLIPDGTSIENGAFGLLNVKATEDLRFQAGLRFDSKRIETDSFVPAEVGDGNSEFFEFDESYETLNYSVGVKYDVNDFTLRFNTASGYRAPNLSELLSNGEHGGSGQIEIGDRTLDSERAIQLDFEVGYKNDKGLNITVNPFFNSISDYIFLTPTGERDGISATNPTGLPVFVYLQEDATLFGGEFNLTYNPLYLPKLYFQTGASLTYGNDSSDDPLPFIPPVNFNTKITYDLHYGKELKLNSVYLQQLNFLEQNRIADEEIANDDYHLINLGFDASYKAFDFSFTVKNIFDQEYTDHLSRLKTAFEDVVVSNPGRDIVFNLKYNF